MGEPDGRGPGHAPGEASSAPVAANNLRAITAITLAMASFACGDTLMKLASASLPTSQLLFIRGGIIFTVSLSIAFFTGALREIRHVLAVRTSASV